MKEPKIRVGCRVTPLSPYGVCLVQAIVLVGCHGVQPRRSLKQPAHQASQTSASDERIAGITVKLEDGQELRFTSREEFEAFMKNRGRLGDWGSESGWQ